MKGSKKQIAWAQKIISIKKQAAIGAGISPEQWDAAASMIDSAATWIEMRDVPAKSIARITAIADMPAIEAKGPYERKYAEDMRIAKIARVDAAIKDTIPDREARINAIISEMGQVRSAREWIDTPTMDMLREANKAAKEHRVGPAAHWQARPEPTPEPTPEPQIKNLTADEIAAEYSYGMAKIVVNAGKNITGMMYIDAGVVDALRPDAAARRAAEILQRRAEKWTGNHAQELADALSEAVASSDSPHEAAEKIRAMEGNYAETLARTEMARVREEANIEIMHRQGVDQVQFLAAPDERMCPFCGAHHGKVYNIRDAPVLPLHPNCRCTLVPYTPDEGGI